MDPTRWQAVEELFSRAVDLPAERQRPAIEEMCANDPTLVAEVLSLLEEDRHANLLLDSGVDQAAAAVLDFGRLPSLIQQQIGPYRLLRLLGEGGMGVVYLAERTDIGGHVAIKLLRDAWLSPMRRQRFRMEQLTLAQLNHPSIARIYDSGMLDDGTPWFVMEYADGLPLTEYWKQQQGAVRDGLLLFRRYAAAAGSHRRVLHRETGARPQCSRSGSGANEANPAVYRESLPGRRSICRASHRPPCCRSAGAWPAGGSQPRW
jgi:serine/threonine-protein kinase